MTARRMKPFSLAPFALLAALTALGGCVALDNYPSKGDARPHPGVEAARQYPIQGIDISRWQGEIDWASVKAAGTRFVYIKATEGGDHIDPAFLRNWEGARRAGIPRGAYHFVYWCRPAHEQAVWFKQHIPNDPEALPPVLDLEWNGHSKTCPKKVERSLALAARLAKARIVTMAQARILAGIAEIAPAAWDACLPGEAECHAYYSACDGAASQSGVGLRVTAAVVEEADEIVALAPFFRLNYRLDTPLQGKLRSFGDALYRHAPGLVTLKVLCVGSPYAERCHLGFSPKLDAAGRIAAVEALAAALERQA
eukprot:gene30441-39226_t